MTIAVVLGNRNNDDGTLSTAGIERMHMAMQLLDSTDIDCVILSGGIANTTANISESALMQQYLVAHGHTNCNIILEDNSLSTVQNAQYCAPIINNMMPDRVVLITSASHMNRRVLNPIRLFAKYLDHNITIIPYTGGTL